MAADQHSTRSEPAPTRLPRTVLWAFSGGGMRGLDIHAAAVRAAFDAGLSAPTHLIGTSAGAIIAALLATGTWADEAICQFILGLTDRQVRRELLGWKLRLPWITHFLAHEPIEQILRAVLPGGWQSLQKPLRIVATDLPRNRTAHIDGSWGISVQHAVLASMSILGVFPTVRIHGRDYADGGTTENLPIWPRVGDERPFDEIVLFVASAPMRYDTSRGGILSRLMANVHSLSADQVEDTISRTMEGRAIGQTVRLVRPLVGMDRGSLRFAHDLQDEAYLQALSQIRDSQNSPITQEDLP